MSMTPSVVYKRLTQCSSSPPSSISHKLPTLQSTVHIYIRRRSGVVVSSSKIMTTESLRLIMSEVSARKMDMQMQPELSLGPTWPALGFASKSSSSSESDGSSRKKRKHYTWEWEEPVSHLELHLGDPLPLDWEQCLDLQSGRMYYLNRKTLKRSWNRPKEQDVNLELNMSTTPTTMNVIVGAAAPALSQAAGTNNRGSTVVSSSGGGNMIAVPCANCHLLVMLCKSSPSCPNCKFVQSLAPPPAAAAHRSRIDATVKPLQTLSLLH
uniref:Uncharacterized protein n=1 Tax=Avena sativa TaxID=4498 RepID=A0ACD5XEF3_AVESA